MIEVEVILDTTWPDRVHRVKINGDRLTPSNVRDALTDGRYVYREGVVWWPDGGYGYRIYRHSVRKLHKRWQEASGE